MDYEKFFNTHYGPIRTFIYKMVLDWHIAEDLTQDVFLSFFRVDKTGKRMDGDINYLYQCARNRVYSHTEKQQRYNNFYNRYSDIDHEEVIEQHYIKNERDELQQERLSWALDEIKRIPGRSGDVTRLYYIDGLTPELICEKLGIQKHSVYTNKNRIIDKVRKRIRKLMHQ